MDLLTIKNTYLDSRPLYFSIVVKGKVNENAAWYYPNPSDAAMNIKNYVSFWRGEEVVEPEGYEQPKTAWWKVDFKRS